MKILLFTTLLGSWSGLIAFTILKKKIATIAAVTLKPLFVQQEQKILNNLYSNFSAHVSDDVYDLQMISSFARTKNILLSDAAAKKLLKMKRLSNVNLEKAITGISSEHFQCIGENELETILAL